MWGKIFKALKGIIWTLIIISGGLFALAFRIAIACFYLITKLLEIAFAHLNKALELIILGDKIK